MSLSTTSSRPLPRERIDAMVADASATLCAASAGVHAALVLPHAAESARLSAAFVIVTVALAIAAVSQAVAPSPSVCAAAAALLLAVAAAYVLSRTTGIPVLIEQAEPFDAFGWVVASLEVLAAVLSLQLLVTRNAR